MDDDEDLSHLCVILPDGRVLLGNGGLLLSNVHGPWRCVGRTCILHSPTEHHMRSWPLVWREDRKLFERRCQHGTGHPDPDQQYFWDEIGDSTAGIHSCDGCCG